MSCTHLWLPHQGAFFRYVFCGRCRERRRVKWAPVKSHPCVADALDEAVERGVLPAEEVTWRGRQRP